MSGKHYIPRGDAPFDKWQKNFMKHLINGYGSWNIPLARVNKLKALQTQWKTAFAKGGKGADRKSSDVIAKQRTRKLYEKEIRQFIGEFIRKNSAVTDDERKAMKLTVADTELTSRRQIETAPTVKLLPKAGARFIVECRVEAKSTRPSRHEHSDGVELAYIVAEKDNPPANPEEATERKLSGSARVRLELDLADTGKQLFVFARWINTTDDSKNGPWSTMASRVIID